MKETDKKERSLQSDHSSAAEFMKRICKSHGVITSQEIEVKLRWENTTTYFFSLPGPHEKDSDTSLLRSADQESLFESHPGMSVLKCGKNKQENKLVDSKNILREPSLSLPVKADDISKAISHPWGFNGTCPVHKYKHCVKLLAVDVFAFVDRQGCTAMFDSRDVPPSQSQRSSSFHAGGDGRAQRSVTN